MDTTPLPSPLTPADCNLRDFAFMPLDVVRLRDSEMAASETPEACWAAVLLWCAAWHQVPAGSMPADEMWLARQAGYARRGRIDPEWEGVRSGALRGWIKCSDGRLYHPVVAEKANEAWMSKHKHAYGKLADRIRKSNRSRAEKGLPDLEIPVFDDWISSGMPMEKDLFPAATQRKYASDPTESGESSAGIPPENTLKGQGQGQGYKDKEKPLSGKPDPAAQDEGPASIEEVRTQQAREVIGYLNAKTGRDYQHVEANLKLVRARLVEGASLEQVKAVIDAKVGEWGKDHAMAEYLRPKTLFNATNFANYVGQLGSKPARATGPTGTGDYWVPAGFETYADAICAGCDEYTAWMYEGGEKVREDFGEGWRETRQRVLAERGRTCSA